MIVRRREFMKIRRHVSAVMTALVLTGISYSAMATEINVPLAIKQRSYWV